MDTVAKSLLLSSSLFAFFSIVAQSSDPCQPATCDASIGLEVRFPFRLVNRQPPSCGYPGFDLYCDGKNRTILNLPRSGGFRVDYIDYMAQALLINDPDSCLPNRILNFSLLGSSFSGAFVWRYTFFNCSSRWMNYSSSYSYPFVLLDCLSGGNYRVVAARSRLSEADVPPSCRSIASVLVPLQWAASQFYWASPDLTEDLELVWREPSCEDCENRGGLCGYISGSGREIGCSRSSRSGLPRSAKYGIVFGVGIPGLLCVIGLARYSFGMIKARSRPNSDLLASTTSEPQSVVRAIGGLDMPTIASYPKTVLGESGRLPDPPAGGTCPICLCEYQPKEALRSIPECNHYFHAGCIDEWLMINGSCPLCRNSPPTSTATPTSTMSLSSPQSTLSNHQ